MKFGFLKSSDTFLDYNVVDKKNKFACLADAKGKNLNLGCGSKYIKWFVNLDINTQNKKVDIVGKGEFLPFKDGVFSSVYIDHVLEYTSRPWQVAAEVKRVLKSGGIVYVSAAFIYAYHPHPQDNFRFTLSGLKNLFV